MANVTENLQKLGLPTGDMPDGSPNLMLPSIFQQLKGNNEESLNNSKTEVWVPPTAVAAVGGGSTRFPIRSSWKKLLNMDDKLKNVILNYKSLPNKELEFGLG